LWSDPFFSFTTPNPPGIPSPLTPLVNSLQTDYSPTLTWSKPILPITPGSAPFQKYQVQVATDTDFLTIVRDESNLTNYLLPQWTVSPDLDPNGKYYWRVRAWDTLDHYSPWSKTYYFRSAMPAPLLTAPADTAVIPTLRPAFDWEDVAGITTYSIQVSKNNIYTLLVVNATATSSTYTPPVNLPANITLYWRVRANGLNGPSVWSTVWTFKIVP
jgi:hypothetical protein